MADDTLQLPEGYEDAQPVKASATAEGVQLPAGYEDAKPVAAKTPTTTDTLTAGKTDSLWDKANKPLLEQPKIEKRATEYAESAPTVSESEHPYRTALKKFGAGVVGSTEKMARDFSSPLGLATMAAGPIVEGAAEAMPAVKELAASTPYLKPALKYGQRALGAAFGTQGAIGAEKGAEQAYKEGGFTPETAEQTLGGAGIAAMGAAGGLHDTKVGAEPATKALAAPVRAASKMGKPLSHIIPSVGGIIAASEAGIPHPFIVGGTVGRFILPPAVLERMFASGRTLGLNTEEANIVHLQDRYEDAKHEAKAPQKAYDAHDASRQQGIPAPEDVIKAHEKAQNNLREAEEHLKTAQKDYADKMASKGAPVETPITPEAVEAARPEAPAPTDEELKTRQEALMGKMEEKAGVEKPTPAAENVKLPGQVQPETFPQEPTEAPKVDETTRMRPLGGDKGVLMGRKPLQLGEGTPEAAPAAPETPKAPLGEILPPEKPAKPGRLGTLKVAEGGKVIDAEEPLQQKIEEGLQGTTKPVAVPPVSRAFEEVLPKHEEITAEEPKEEVKAEPKKFEEALPKHEEIKEERSPEDLAKVQKLLSDHTDQELIREANRRGIDESQYDFNKRDEKRHRADRERLVNDIMDKMPDEEKDKLAGLANNFDSKDETTWTQAERNNLSRAQRARAIMQEHRGGITTGEGGAAPEANTEEGAKQDQAYFAQAKKELPEGTVSEQLLRAQELKEQSAKTESKESASAKADYDKEKEFSDKVLSGEKKVEDFPYHDSYKKTIDEESKLIKPGSKVLFVGGGPMPLSSMLLADHGFNVDTLEIDPETTKIGEKVADKASAKTGKFITGDARNFDKYKDYDAVVVALEAGPESESKNAVLKQVMEQAKPDATILARGTSGKGGESFVSTSKNLPEGVRVANSIDTFDGLSKTHVLENQDASIAKEHNENAGSSLLKDGKVEDGYSVGINKFLEKILDKEKITPEDVKKYRDDPAVQKALKDNHNAFIGTWVDNGKTYLDTSVHEPDLETAKKIGRDNKQLAIFDAKNKSSIDLEPEGVHKPGEAESDEEMARRGAKVTEEKATQNQKEMSPEERVKVQEELAKRGAGGGSAAPSKAKAMPTGDELIKKYGESDGDPAHTAFILPDGRGVAQTGTIHDEMLGGKATDKTPRRQQFVEAGNVRMRARTGGGGREFSVSIPESGITTDQLEHLKKMAPQMGSGKVLVEIGKPGGAFREIEYGKASDQLEKSLREIAPIKEGKLPALAEQHLLPEEKEGVSKSKQQLERFVGRMAEMPKVREFVDAASKGAGERKWYQRSTQAFDAMSQEAPNYFDQEGDRDKFIGLLASSSPQQAVVENMKEALRVWTNYVDNGRPTGAALEKLLSKSKVEGGFTLPEAKIPNAMKALAGEPLWPDITKNKNFKVPSFRDNLTGMLQRVTNDGWMALFSGLEAKDISSAHSYHPISVMTRAAAEELGWEPAEAQAAIWAFIKTLTEKGVDASEDPHEMRQYSEDFADIIQHDPQTRALLKDMGVNHAELDKRLAAIERKPEPNASGVSPTSEDSAKRAFARVEKARGKGTIPPAKTGLLKFGEPEDANTSFNPEEFKSGETPKQITKNASGESAASQEAINRAASEKKKGTKYFRVDSRSGRETPIIGTDALDAKAGQYEHIVRRGPDGDIILDSGKGAKPLGSIKRR